MIRSKVIEYFEKNGIKYYEDYKVGKDNDLQCLACHSESVVKILMDIGDYLQSEGVIEVTDEFEGADIEDTPDGIIVFFPNM